MTREWFDYLGAFSAAKLESEGKALVEFDTPTGSADSASVREPRVS